MVPDIDIHHYYEKYIEDANSDIERFKENHNVAVKMRDSLKQYLLSNITYIANSLGIKLVEYGQEWIDGIYNPKRLLINKVYDKLEEYKAGEERIMLMQIVKYCNVLRKINALNSYIRLAKKRSELTFKQYRDYVAKFYQYGVHKCCLEGYAYGYGYGLGDLMINRWTHDPKDNKRKRIDYRKTASAKEKLIAEGKKPYDRKEAEIYKLRGLKYDGVPYVVYQEDTSFYNIDIVNNQYVAHQNLDFEHTEYYSKELRGKSHEENAAEIKDKKEVYSIKADLRTKLKLYTLVDKGAYLNYIRNVDQKKYQRGAHNSKNRKRF